MKKKIMMGMMCILIAATTACGSGDGSNKDAASKAKRQNKDGKTIVTLSSLYVYPYFEALEKKFEQKYPDIDLQIQAYLGIEEKMTETAIEKYLKQMNSTMLTGEGADIIEMSYLPVEKYVSKKMLVNMNDRLEADQTINKSDLNMNVLNGMKINGGLYSVPSSFFVGTFVGNGDALAKTVKVDEKNWTWTQFEEVARKFKASSRKDQFALTSYAPERFLQILVKNNLTDFIDADNRQAKFDTPLFIQSLKQIQKMYDEKILSASAGKPNNQLFYHTYLYSPLDVAQVAFNFYANPKLLPTPHTKEDVPGTTFLIPNQLGISANSPVKDEAWKFIAFLMSKEAQSMNDGEGFSLLASVNEQMLQDIKKRVKDGEITTKMTDRHYDELKQLIQSASSLAQADDKLLSMIEEESKSYFSGQKSAEEVAKLIQNRTTTYLNE
ncbi:extracellular solute-binding protein [Paenibacillus sp. UMB4589-SE434]|uniref:ABC transporter substrate-binding protein n=1 Tax=Paenibacillus sp. UMB4589-SE434 TaxID=3046314 RepID=UPI00254C544F|nr:extracellular solute-binding protein [Paenibacillus sp. UMB4589-SE434]MDK8180033.1 extracellular solute-binding protein [Paenibacillus sp. UMB4589-SE434]